MSSFLFNIDMGYLEGICRGFKNGLLTEENYYNLVQSETLNDIKLELEATSYGKYLSQLNLPLSISAINEKLTQNLIDEFKYIRNQSVEPLSTFLDFITYSYMIDNVILLLSGLNNRKGILELLKKCHPLGIFTEMNAVSVAESPADLYNAILIDASIAQFFSDRIVELDFHETNVEILKNILHKHYLEGFYKLCKEIGGKTSDVMCDILAFEADRRSIMITINSMHTELKREERAELFPNFGYLYPYGCIELSKAVHFDHVEILAEKYNNYSIIFNESKFNSKSLEDCFFEKEVKLNLISFMQQFHYGIFYSYFKLKEQEIRNILWISECVQIQEKFKINNYISMVL